MASSAVSIILIALVFISLVSVDSESGQPWNSADALAPDIRTPEIRYIANSGMLVSMAGRRFLIDAPIRDGIDPYATSSADERARLEGSKPPYDGIDAILVTHWHEDHFSAAAVAAHLSRNLRTTFISSPEVVDRLRATAPAIPVSQLRAVLPPPGAVEQVDIGGVPVRVLRIRHNPSRRLPEQHVGFLIGTSPTVLHVGDADPAVDNFALLREVPRVGVALLPFWYLSDAANRRLVNASIRPDRVVAMHVPPSDAQNVVASLRAANINASVATVPGTPIAIDE
jgi:L-ascorbate metabolism protein UlaG (beta-lactamase superfamily)